MNSSKINLMAAKNLLQVWIQNKNADGSNYRILIFIYICIIIKLMLMCHEFF